MLLNQLSLINNDIVDDLHIQICSHYVSTFEVFNPPFSVYRNFRYFQIWHEFEFFEYKKYYPVLFNILDQDALFPIHYSQHLIIFSFQSFHINIFFYLLLWFLISILNFVKESQFGFQFFLLLSLTRKWGLIFPSIKSRQISNQIIQQLAIQLYINIIYIAKMQQHVFFSQSSDENHNREEFKWSDNIAKSVEALKDEKFNIPRKQRKQKKVQKIKLKYQPNIQKLNAKIPWTQEQDQLFIDKFVQTKGNYHVIKSFLPERTLVACRLRVQTYKNSYDQTKYQIIQRALEGGKVSRGRKKKVQKDSPSISQNSLQMSDWSSEQPKILKKLKTLQASNRKGQQTNIEEDSRQQIQVSQDRQNKTKKQVQIKNKNEIQTRKQKTRDKEQKKQKQAEEQLKIHTQREQQKKNIQKLYQLEDEQETLKIKIKRTDLRRVHDGIQVFGSYEQNLLEIVQRAVKNSS